MLLTPFANNLINLVQKRNRGNKHEPKHRPMFWAYSENFFCLFFACSLSYFDVFFLFGEICVLTLSYVLHMTAKTVVNMANWHPIGWPFPLCILFTKLLTLFRVLPYTYLEYWEHSDSKLTWNTFTIEMQKSLDWFEPFRLELPSNKPRPN